MAYKPARGRIPLREQMLSNRAVMLAMCPDQEARDRLMRELPEIAEKKVRAAKSGEGKSEKRDVQDPALELLRSHPKVAFAIRINSGTFVETNADGSKRFIQANNIGRKDMLVVDIIGMMKTGVFFAIECKHPDWKKPHGDREEKQEAFILHVVKHNGISGFARSVDDVIRILEAA